MQKTIGQMIVSKNSIKFISNTFLFIELPSNIVRHLKKC